jgi:hypothetical protein
MASAEKEKTLFITEIPLGVASGDGTPTFPSSDDVTINDADKRLEAMGYTPVRFSRRFLGV